MKYGKNIGLFALFVVGILVSAASISAYNADFVEKSDCVIKGESLEYMTYDEFKVVMQGKGLLKFVNEDNFDNFVLMHNALNNGDYDLAAEIRVELGLGVKSEFKDGSGFGDKIQKQNKTQQHKRLQMHK